MTTYILRRLLFSIPVLFAASVIIFTFVALAGDPLGELRVNPLISEQSLQNIIEQEHLAEPLHIRYGYWLKDAVTDRFGTYLLSERAIWPDLQRALFNTLQLILTAEFLALVLAIAIGVYSAVKQYSLFDYTATGLSFLGFSTPIFWLALILQVIFVYIFNETGVRIFYVYQLSSPDPENWFLDRLQHLALPVFTLAFISIAQYTRYMRASMLEVINADYVRTARAKGVPEWRSVIMKHSLRNGLIPLTTVFAINFGTLFGGAIVTETIFTIDGMGLFFIESLAGRDIYAIMAWLMTSAVIIIFFNLVADILYGVFDPRIRYD